MPPTVTYKGYKLAAVDNIFSHLGFAGERGRCSELSLTALTIGRNLDFDGEEIVGLGGWGLKLKVKFRWFCGGERKGLRLKVRDMM